MKKWILLMIAVSVSQVESYNFRARRRPVRRVQKTHQQQVQQQPVEAPAVSFANQRPTPSGSPRDDRGKMPHEAVVFHSSPSAQQRQVFVEEGSSQGGFAQSIFGNAGVEKAPMDSRRIRAERKPPLDSGIHSGASGWRKRPERNAASRSEKQKLSNEGLPLRPYRGVFYSKTQNGFTVDPGLLHRWSAQ